jgi:GDP-L-fucose synthase
VGGLGYVAEHAIEVFEDNLRMAMGLLGGIKKAKAPKTLITIMPNCTYPGAKDIHREAEWWDGPIHDSVLMYGLPRKTLWGLCKTYGRAIDLQSTHLIFPNMYGPGDHFESQRSHALGALIAKIMKAKHQATRSVEIWGTGRPVREWMYVQDAAEAVLHFLKVLENDSSAATEHPVYNVGIGRGISIAELAELIREAAGWDGGFNFDDRRPDGDMQKLTDGSRFRQLTGWRPETTLRQGIAQTVEWYQHNLESECVHVH